MTHRRYYTPEIDLNARNESRPGWRPSLLTLLPCPFTHGFLHLKDFDKDPKTSRARRKEKVAWSHLQEVLHARRCD